jgi:hypothetical protein
MNPHMTFALGQRAGNPTDDVVKLGHYDFNADGTGSITYWSFAGRQNLAGIQTPLHHPPVLGKVGGPILLPRYGTVVSQQPIHWQASAPDELVVVFGANTYRWRQAAGNRYTLASLHPAVPQCYGYSFLCDSIVSAQPLTHADLYDSYNGVYSHTVAVSPAPPPVLHVDESTAWHTTNYRAYEGGNVLAMAYPDSNEGNENVFSTILLNYAPHSKLILYHNEGHDFNHDDAFDELGHTLMFFGCKDTTGKVSGIVFIEASFQTSGYSIMAAGCYYR